MNLRDAGLMVLGEAAPDTDLFDVAHAVCDDHSAGRQVSCRAPTGMLAEASRKGVPIRLKRRYGDVAVNEMVTVLGREADRLRPIPD